MVEEKVINTGKDDKRRRTSVGADGNDMRISSKPARISEILSGEEKRIDTGIGELNRVLGGGLVSGSLVLISGEPGIGLSLIHISEPTRPY